MVKAKANDPSQPFHCYGEIQIDRRLQQIRRKDKLYLAFDHCLNF